MSRPAAIAHRGASGRELENTLAAFRLAGTMGADGVELDIHATADGALVVHHDHVIGTRPISQMSLAEVRARPLRNGEPIPTLDAALHAILPGMFAWVEIKAQEARWDPVLLRVFDESPAPDRIAVHSFDHRIVRRLGELRPSLPRGILLSARLLDSGPALRAAGANALWQHADQVDAGLVDEVHRAGAQVIAWTVDDPAIMNTLLGWGVDGLCSNHPDRARRAIDSFSL